jgi:hypothetical protein
VVSYPQASQTFTDRPGAIGCSAEADAIEEPRYDIGRQICVDPIMPENRSRPGGVPRFSEEIALLGASAAPSKSKSHEDCATKNPNHPDAS